MQVQRPPPLPEQRQPPDRSPRIGIAQRSAPTCPPRSCSARIPGNRTGRSRPCPTSPATGHTGSRPRHTTRNSSQRRSRDHLRPGARRHKHRGSIPPRLLPLPIRQLPPLRMRPLTMSPLQTQTLLSRPRERPATQRTQARHRHKQLPPQRILNIRRDEPVRPILLPSPSRPTHPVTHNTTSTAPTYAPIQSAATPMTNAHACNRARNITAPPIGAHTCPATPS